MKITKLGHCCLLIEIQGVKILTDPGAFSTTQNQVTGIDLILITHEHPDHLHVDSLRTVLANNPHAQVVTNSSVGAILSQENIPYIVLEGKAEQTVLGVALCACDAPHEVVWRSLPRVQNTGYLIANLLYYPGDAFSDPKTKIEILALPVAGPWCRIRDSIAYALRLKPKYAFPVHDGMLQADKMGSAHFAPNKILGENGINFVPLVAGDSHQF